MKTAHLALVASYTDGRSRVEHPVDSVDAVERVYGWLGRPVDGQPPLVPADAWWSVEAV